MSAEHSRRLRRRAITLSGPFCRVPQESCPRRRCRLRRLRLLVNFRDPKELVAFDQRLLAEQFDRDRVGMLRAVKKV